MDWDLNRLENLTLEQLCAFRGIGLALASNIMAAAELALRMRTSNSLLLREKNQALCLQTANWPCSVFSRSNFVMLKPFAMPHPLILIAAVLLIALTTVIRLFVSRRRFYRRSWGGLQFFRSYRQSFICMIFENFLLFIATACVIVAIILAMIYFIH